MSLDKLNDYFIRPVGDNLNSRLRKILGYQTPPEIKSRFGYIVLRY